MATAPEERGQVLRSPNSMSSRALTAFQREPILVGWSPDTTSGRGSQTHPNPTIGVLRSNACSVWSA